MVLASFNGKGVRQAFLLLALAFLAGADLGARPCARGAEPPCAAPLDASGFQRGFTLTSYWCDDYENMDLDDLQALLDTGADSIAVLTTWYEDYDPDTGLYDPAVRPLADTKTPSDAGLIRVIGVLVPRRLRADWRQEWEAELRYRETLLAEWDSLNLTASQDDQMAATQTVDPLWWMDLRRAALEGGPS